MIRYLPLVFILIYLSITQFIFLFGPINYKINQPFIFWSFLISYNISIFIGFFCIVFSKKKLVIKKSIQFEKNIIKYIPYLFFISLIVSLITLKGPDSLVDRLNPIIWFKSAFFGILNPGEAYNLKMERVNNDSSNKILNIILFLLSFTKICVIPFLIFFWNKISNIIRIIGIISMLLPIISSLSNGTNKGIFDFALVFSSSFILYFIFKKIHNPFISFSNKRFSIIFILLIFSLAFSFFGSTIGQRGGSLYYIESQDPLDRITVNAESYSRTKNSNIYYTYAWFSSYIVQGYYGFSLALEQPFNSTFGFGSSVFIMRNIEYLTGFKLRKRTYQYKVDKYWDETSQWHSFYSHLANDFHFIGIPIVLILLSAHLGYIWINFLETGNPFSVVILCIYVILFIFIPANNQIFGFLDGLSSYFWINILWYLSNKKYFKKINIYAIK